MLGSELFVIDVFNCSLKFAVKWATVDFVKRNAQGILCFFFVLLHYPVSQWGATVGLGIERSRVRNSLVPSDFLIRQGN